MFGSLLIQTFQIGVDYKRLILFQNKTKLSSHIHTNQGYEVCNSNENKNEDCSLVICLVSISMISWNINLPIVLIVAVALFGLENSEMNLTFQFSWWAHTYSPFIIVPCLLVIFDVLPFLSYK